MIAQGVGLDPADAGSWLAEKSPDAVASALVAAVEEVRVPHDYLADGTAVLHAALRHAARVSG